MNRTQVTNGYATYYLLGIEDGIATLERFHPYRKFTDNPVQLRENEIWPWNGEKVGDRNYAQAKRVSR